MEITIQAVQEPDLPTIGRLTTASKMALSINRLLWKNWPDEEKQQEQCLNAATNSFYDDAAMMLKAVDNKNGEIVGALVLIRRLPKQDIQPPVSGAESDPESSSEQQAQGQPQAIPDKFNPEVLTAVMAAVEEINKENEKNEYFELTFIVISQPHRGKGIGTKLMSEAQQLARAENLPIVTQVEPAAHTFFKKCGFTDTKHVDFDLSVWAVPFSGFGLFRLAGMVWTR